MENRCTPQRGKRPVIGATQDRINVLCVDDNAHLVQALEQRLALEPDFGWMPSVGNLDHVVEEVLKHKPNLVLLDVDLPGTRDALSVLRSVAEQAPEARVVVFTGYPTDELMEQAVAGGGWGLIAKGVGTDRLLSALRRVNAGEAVFELDE
jgi:two-component system, NarL family, response regulator DesR